jgi:type I restriction enzyme, S subunit
MKIDSPLATISRWPSRRARVLFEREQREPRDYDGIVTAFRDGQVTLRSKRREEGFTNAVQEIGYQGVRRGDLVIHSMDGFAGAIGVSDSDGKSSPVVHCYRAKPEVDARYYAYLLRDLALRGFIRSLARGIRERSTAFDSETFRSLLLPFPAISQQRAIANFLDRETARIDALIAAKRRMLEIAAVRFQVRGHELMTGGAPTEVWAPGPHWLGPVPVSWKPHKVSWYLSTGSGTTPSSDRLDYYADKGVPWVTTTELRETVITETAKCVTDVALRECSALKLFPAGTVLVAMYGATVGRVGVLGVSATLNQACCAIYGSGDLSSRFLYWWLRLHRKDLLDMAYGSGQPNISQETIRSLRVPSPTLVEQERIADHLTEAAKSLRSLTQNVTRQIDLLVEHRQALITAIVTGEIEVPGVVA